MNTGGYARLSTSFFSDSDSIQRKTRIAGETMTTTDSQKRSGAACGAAGRAGDVPAQCRCASGPFHRWRT
jgi:hypothetical protein